MDFLTMLQIGGTVMKAGSFLQSGRGAQEQAGFDSYQLGIKRRQDAIIGREKMNIRNRQFAANESVNRAMFFSGLNRDASDRSFKAFMERQKRVKDQDIDAINTQTVIALGQTDTKLKAVSAQAQNAYESSLLGATSAVASGLYAYEEYRTDGGLFSTEA